MSFPNPSVLARLKKPATPVVETIVADIRPESPAKIVRPGFQEVVTIEAHDGIVKAKQVEKGMTIRAFLHNKPCGGERVVEAVERSADGSTVTLTFSSAHPKTEYKAAYRFFVKALVGTPVEKISHVPALVAYEEV